jgi:hypothetical protein
MLSAKRIFELRKICLCNEKDSVIFIREEQIEILKDSIQTQGLDLPSEAPTSAPTPAPAPQTMALPPSRNVGQSIVPGYHYGPEHNDPGWGSIRMNPPASNNQPRSWLG